MDDQPVTTQWIVEWHAIQSAVFLILIAAVVLIIIGAGILDRYVAQSVIGECVAIMEKTR